jgi:hypothetical protein
MLQSHCQRGTATEPPEPNDELFRVPEGFPDLAHDDEVDACSGALEMFVRVARAARSAQFALARPQLSNSAIERTTAMLKSSTVCRRFSTP